MDETISLLRLAQDAVAAVAPGTYATLEESGGSGENIRSRQHKEIQIDVKFARTFSTRTHRVFYLEGAAYIRFLEMSEATCSNHIISTYYFISSLWAVEKRSKLGIT
jgi:hypothetical protein